MLESSGVESTLVGLSRRPNDVFVVIVVVVVAVVVAVVVDTPLTLRPKIICWSS